MDNFQKFDDDDLLDDLMNIVQNDEQQQQHQHQINIDNKSADNKEFQFDVEDAEQEEDFYEDDCDDEEMFIDQMLEKPIDILDEKDQVNFYTYDKIQIKSKR